MSSARTIDVWETIAREAAAESSLWRDALKPENALGREPVFSPLADERFALGLETIYEGYLVHYGEPRVFAAWYGLADVAAHARVAASTASIMPR